MTVKLAVHNLLSWTHGRTTAFFVAFFAIGHVIFFMGKMTPTYIYYMATLGGLVLGHSVKDDIAQRINGRRDAVDPTNKG